MVECGGIGRAPSSLLKESLRYRRLFHGRISTDCSKPVRRLPNRSKFQSVSVPKFINHFALSLWLPITDKLLSDNWKETRLLDLRRPKSTVPLNKFFPRLRVSRLGSLKIESEIGPCSLLSPRPSKINWVWFPIQDGI
ncbi:hypothetical protein NC651_035871 [Populus alba x Populus x berolinensis]|nr:hypothetical protein NC651_035871 [Populus alba x Populus x berolinensis]